MPPSDDVTILDSKKESGEAQISTQLLNSGSSKVYAPRIGKRHVQVLFYGMFNFISTSVNSCMSISLVAMADPTTTSNKNIPTYNWTQKGTIFSAFIWGVMSTQILSGWLSSRYGGKWVLIISNGLCSVSMFLVPLVVHNFGFVGLVTTRFFQGFFTGFTSSAVLSLLAKWAPSQERSSLAIISGSGFTAGTVLTIFTTGYIAASWYGWPMIFYALGSLQMLLALIFVYIGSASPADHPTISHQEVLYIDSSTTVERNRQVLSTPWVKILTSSSFWSLVLVQCSYVAGLHMLKLETPIYFSKVMGLDMKSNSLLSTLPFLVKWFLGYVFSFVSDWLLIKKILTLGRSRKMLVTIGYSVSALALVGLANCSKNNVTIATILLVIAVGFMASVLAGYLVNHIDLSPNHAGTSMGIANQLALVWSGSGLLIVQYIVTDETDPSQWQIVFYTAAALFVASTVIFNVFGSGKIQPWNANTSNNQV